jgi:hypothetical protein
MVIWEMSVEWSSPMRNVSFGIIAFMAPIVLMLAGCGKSQPSESDGEKIIRDKIAGQSEGHIKLVSFKKTNGQAKEEEGISKYNLEYQAEIEFDKDCVWQYMGGGYFILYKIAELPSDWDGKFGGATMKRGQHVKLSGTVVFQKKENGWVGRDISGAPLNPANGT